jgi:four helix bundle protein
MANKIKCFEDLIIWQKAQDMAVKIYKLVEQTDFIKKDFSLKDQFKTAVLSISDNIAEGFEYNNNPDFYRFLRISKGSCGEIRNKIHFIKRLEFISVEAAMELITEAELLGNQIGELMKKVKQKIKSSKGPSEKSNVRLVTRNP